MELPELRMKIQDVIDGDNLFLVIEDFMGPNRISEIQIVRTYRREGGETVVARIGKAALEALKIALNSKGVVGRDED